MSESSSKGVWTPSQSLLSVAMEDLPLDRIHIFFTPPPPEPGSETSGKAKASSRESETTPSKPEVKVINYTVDTSDLAREYLDIDVDEKGVDISSGGFEGIFEISISFIDISDHSDHTVYRWEDVPSGYLYQIYKYSPPPEIEKNFDIIVNAHLSDNTVESKKYYLRVRTNLDRNTRILQKKIKENARNGKTR